MPGYLVAFFVTSLSYNVSQLEEWLRSRDVHAGGTVDTLEPLIQAARLLQVAKKTDADAQDLVLTCTALYNQQVAHRISLPPSLDTTSALAMSHKLMASCLCYRL